MRLVLRPILWMVLALATVIVVTFALMHAAPGSPWDAPLDPAGPGGPNAQAFSPAAIRSLDKRYGLDKPWSVQLGRYAWSVLHLDLGESYQYPTQPVRTLILRNWTHTAALGLLSFLVIVPVGIGLGLLSAAAHNSPTDRMITALTTLGGSIPNFVVGIFLILTLSVGLYRMTDGSYSLPTSGFGYDEHLILPIITLSLLPTSFLARLTRASALEIRRQDYVRTATAKGMRPGTVLIGHVLPNAMLPVLTALGPLLAILLTGSFVVESLFRIPGLGGTFVTAVSARDYPVILGATIVYSLLFFVANLAVDLLYAVADPRLRSRSWS